MAKGLIKSIKSGSWEELKNCAWTRLEFELPALSLGMARFMVRSCDVVCELSTIR